MSTSLIQHHVLPNPPCPQEKEKKTHKNKTKQKEKEKEKHSRNPNPSSLPYHRRTYPMDDLILTIDMNSDPANLRATHLPTYLPTYLDLYSHG
jgi:hypothetical protein